MGRDAPLPRPVRQEGRRLNGQLLPLCETNCPSSVLGAIKARAMQAGGGRAPGVPSRPGRGGGPCRHGRPARGGRHCRASLPAEPLHNATSAGRLEAAGRAGCREARTVGMMGEGGGAEGAIVPRDNPPPPKVPPSAPNAGREGTGRHPCACPAWQPAAGITAGGGRGAIVPGRGPHRAGSRPRAAPAWPHAHGLNV